LVAALVRHDDGHGIDSEAFAVGSIGFTSLVAWNARELATAFEQPDDELDALAAELSGAVARRWRGDRWVDDPGRHAPTEPSGGELDQPEAARTVDSLTALLVDPRPEGFDQLVDPEAFGSPFGPRGVHRAEPTYDPDVYWRGSAWPQLTYLLMVAAERAGRRGTARVVARWLVDGAVRSGLAEHWNPETGAGLGATPQTWAGLVLPAIRRF
jgi:glycogen debranching enzyme